MNTEYCCKIVFVLIAPNKQSKQPYHSNIIYKVICKIYIPFKYFNETY